MPTREFNGGVPEEREFKIPLQVTLNVVPSSVIVIVYVVPTTRVTGTLALPVELVDETNGPP